MSLEDAIVKHLYVLDCRFCSHIDVLGFRLPLCPDEEPGLLPVPLLYLVDGDHEIVDRLLGYPAVPPTHAPQPQGPIDGDKSIYIYIYINIYTDIRDILKQAILLVA